MSGIKKNIQRIMLLVFSLFLSTILFGQGPYSTALVGNEKQNYAVSIEGDTAFFYGEAVDFLDPIVYTNKEGKRVRIKRKNVRMAVVNNYKYIKRKDGLGTILAFNKDYILTGFCNGDIGKYHIQDRELNVINKKVIFVGGGEKRRLAVLEENVYPYFKGCEEVKRLLLEQVSGGLSYYNCDNSPDIFTGEIPTEVASIEPKRESYGVNDNGERVVFYNGPSFYGAGQIGYTKTKESKVLAGTTMLEWKYIVMEYDGYTKFLKKYKFPGSRPKKMLDVLVYSDEYVLTRIFQNKYLKDGRYFLFNRDGELVVDKFKEDKLIEVCKEYFDEYPHLQDAINKNMSIYKNATSGFNYLKCAESTKNLIEEIE